MSSQTGYDAQHSLEVFRSLIDNAKPESICFFGGAGVSTASGIPDFRSATGIFNEQYPYPPEVIVSHSFFLEHPQAFYDFYRGKMIFPNAKPNQAHIKLAQLEHAGKVRGVITQNIDGLHQKAGSKKVYELHGSVHKYYCMNCGATYSLDDIMATTDVPRCSLCDGIVRPDVVLYEEPLDPAVIEEAVETIAHSDILIVGGTSLTVYPAAGFLQYFSGDRLIIINHTPTSFDKQADLCLTCDIAHAFDF